MATITLSLSSRTSKDTGKSEVLLRYRNTREVALRAHTHIFIFPKFFAGGQVVIKNRIMTEEVRDAHRAKADLDRIVGHVIEESNKTAISNFYQEWAQETIDQLLFPDKFIKKTDKPSFFQLGELFKDSHKISDARKRQIRNLFGKLTRYEAYSRNKFDIETMTRKTLLDFTNFCRNEHQFYEVEKVRGVYRMQVVKSYRPIMDLTPWSTPYDPARRRLHPRQVRQEIRANQARLLRSTIRHHPPRLIPLRQLQQREEKRRPRVRRHPPRRHLQAKDFNKT